MGLVQVKRGGFDADLSLKRMSDQSRGLCAGLPGRVTDALCRQTGYGYHDNLVVEWEQALPYDQIEPEGNSQVITRDDRGNVTEKRIKAKPGSGLSDLVITAAYPATCTNQKTCNKPEYVIDARGNRTDYTYDPNHGGVLTETRPAVAVPGVANPVRPQKRYRYVQNYSWIKNSSGNFVQASTPVWLLTETSECMTQATCTGTADETKTTITYGTPGSANNLLPTATTVSAGNGSLAATTTKMYDFTGNVVSVDGPLPGSADTTRHRYDALRRVIGTISPDPDGAGPLKHRATRNTYSPSGELIKVEQGTVNDQSDAEWTAFVALESLDAVYDVMGRKLKETKSSSGTATSVVQYSYDAAGRLDCTAIRMDPAQWHAQPNACVAQTTGPYGADRISRIVYDAAGQIRKKQIAVGTTDQADDESYDYTGNGKQAYVQDGENNRTTYEYDGFDRPWKTRFPVATQGAQASSTTDFEQLTYDQNGNVLFRRLRDGQVIGSSYDNLNRLSVKDLPAPETDVSYAYNLQGQPLAVTQGSSSVGRIYDALGRTRSETTSLGVMSYEYDEAGRRRRTSWSDGFFVTQDFLLTDEISAIRESGAQSGVGVLAIYSYDNLGRRTGINRGNGTTTTYGYAASRLTSLSHELAGTAHDVASTFNYNPASQIIVWSRNNPAYAWNGHFNQSKSYSVNGLNQIATAAGVAFAHDLRGNLTNQGLGQYGYTVENRLISAPNNASLIYDSIGRLSQISGKWRKTKRCLPWRDSRNRKHSDSLSATSSCVEEGCNRYPCGIEEDRKGIGGGQQEGKSILHRYPHSANEL